MRGGWPLLPAAALLLAGCGATTVRLAAGPTFDTGGHVGAVGTFTVGFGMPVDFGAGRSHHYVQGSGAIGGGRDGATGAGMVVAATNIDYIYWAEPRMDLKAGIHYAFQNLPNVNGGVSRHGAGAHLGLSPMIHADDTTWLVTHFCLGPKLRAEVLSGSPTGGAMGLFSLPLAAELNLLGAGD